MTFRSGLIGPNRRDRGTDGGISVIRPPHRLNEWINGWMDGWMDQAIQPSFDCKDRATHCVRRAGKNRK